jgi:hypothetical protein
MIKVIFNPGKKEIEKVAISKENAGRILDIPFFKAQCLPTLIDSIILIRRIHLR